MKGCFIVICLSVVMLVSSSWASNEQILFLKRQQSAYQLHFYQLGAPIEYKTELPVAVAISCALTQQIRLDVYLGRISLKNAEAQVVGKWSEWGPTLLEILQRNRLWGVEKPKWFGKRPPSYGELFRDLIDPLNKKIISSDSLRLKELSTKSEDPLSVLLDEFPLQLPIKSRAKDLPTVLLRIGN